MTSGYIAVLFAGTLVLGGCSLAPDYHPPVVETVSNFKENGIWVSATPGKIDVAGWWSAYNDPVLDSLEQKIEKDNPTLAAAVARYDQARGYLAEARADLFPEVGVQTNITDNRQSANRPLRGANEPNFYNADTVGGQIGYELDLWGRVRNSVAANQAKAEASADDVAAIKLDLESDLATSYVALRGDDQQIALLRDTVTAYTKADELTRSRFEGGAASGIDAGRAGTQLAEAQAQLDDVTAARAVTENAIAVLVGAPASSFTIELQSTGFILPPVPVGLPSELLQRRPDVAAAERRVSAANSEIGVARAAFYPSITLGAQGGFQNTGLPGLFSAPNLFWSIGPNTVLTLLDGGLRRAQVDVTRAQWKEATADYREVALKAFREVEDNLAQLHHLGDEADAERRAAEQAARVEKLSFNRYVEGADTYLDVVTAQTTALRTRRTTIDLETRRLQANIHLVAAVGGGWSSATSISSGLAPSPQKAWASNFPHAATDPSTQ